MEDTSFIDLTKVENLKRLSIDARLVPCFKRVMAKLQAYFNANGYTMQRDYASYLKRFLLDDTDEKLSIICDSEPSKIHADGYYSKLGKIIDIDESNLKASNLDDLDSALCHEFIHFLVMNSLVQDDVLKGKADPNIFKGGFINEALTEMLTQQMYPTSHAYAPQVSMMTFANLLTNNVNNYSSFLRGKIDAQGGASSWLNFVILVDEYQNERNDKGFYMSEAITNQHYIDAQRYIIQANVTAHRINSIEEFERITDMLRKRPAPDNEWIDNLIKDMGIFLIRNTSINDPQLNDLLLEQVIELNDINKKLDMYEGADVVETTIGGKVIAFDKNRRIYGATGGYQSGWNSMLNMFSLRINKQTKYFDFSQVDFTKRRKGLIEKRNKILKTFSNNHKRDARAVSNLKTSEGLVRLERFTLPIIGANINKSPYIYVATYEDRIEILDADMQIKEVKDINASKYIGMIPDTGGTWSKPMGTIENGVSFSSLSSKRITGLSIAAYERTIKDELTEEQIAQLIAEYRLSDEYDESDEKDYGKLKQYAIHFFASKQFELLPQEVKNVYASEIIDENPKYVVSTKNGRVQVGVIYGNKMAFVGEGEEIDIHEGVWKKYLDAKKQSKEVKVTPISLSLRTNSKGDLVSFPTRSKFTPIEKTDQTVSYESTEERIINQSMQYINPEEDQGIRM